MEKNSILSTWHQIFVRGWKKNSILSLHLAPNLCERMGKKIHPLTGMIPNLNFVVSYFFCSSKKYHHPFMLLALPVVVVVVLFVAF
jgi:hypothetical protein